MCVALFAFLTLKVTIIIDLHFMNHNEARFQLNIFFPALMKRLIYLFILGSTVIDYWLIYIYIFFSALYYLDWKFYTVKPQLQFHLI